METLEKINQTEVNQEKIIENIVDELLEKPELLEKYTFWVLHRYLDEGKNLMKIGLTRPKFRSDIIKIILSKREIEIDDTVINEELTARLINKIHEPYIKFLDEQIKRKDWNKRHMKDAAAYEKKVTSNGKY